MTVALLVLDGVPEPEYQIQRITALMGKAGFAPRPVLHAELSATAVVRQLDSVWADAT
jgi:hypothetical protein